MFIHIPREVVMKKNLSTSDRIIRVLLAVILGALYLTGQVSGTLGIILGLAAVVVLLTSVFTFCPIYALFNISTMKKAS
jgi:hypothetical protein